MTTKREQKPGVPPFDFCFDSLRGEFDEIFLSNASVHIERMNTRAFWIGIDLPDGRRLHVNTGIDDGEWFFNVEDVGIGGEFHAVRRPACHRKHVAEKGRAK